LLRVSATTAWGGLPLGWLALEQRVEEVFEMLSEGFGLARIQGLLILCLFWLRCAISALAFKRR